MNYEILKSKPFYLTDEEISSIKKTLINMSLEDKIKQLFIDMAAPVNDNIVKHIVNEQKPGGIRYMNKDAASVKSLIDSYQRHSSIPLIVAANTEAGGNGALRGGTEVGKELKIAATNKKENAYWLGKISAREAKAVGCNTVFAPIVDINYNWRNPIIASRTFGSDPNVVATFSKEYIRGCHEENIASICKHFPGDGVDERDQHLANSVNSFSKEHWDETFGHVYKEVIDSGVDGIMVGHIMLPAYEKFYDNEIKEYLPATLSPYLINNLLKEQLGFNGLIITDASHMVGLTSRMKRKDIVPTSIKVGCDMFLFYNDYEEDFNYVLDSIKSGDLSLKRLEEAVIKILAFKARYAKVNNNQDFSVINNNEAKEISDKISHEAITLVKSTEENVLPLTKDKYKNILIIPHEISNPFNSYISNDGELKYYEVIKETLEKAGFNVEIYMPVLSQLKNADNKKVNEIMSKLYTSKSAIKTLTDKYDLIIHLASVPGNAVTQRIDFALTKGAIDIPWYVNELKVIFISLDCPFHLFDVPQVKTYINCYDHNKNTIDALTDKLLGKEEFSGVSQVDAFCGCEDTKW